MIDFMPNIIEVVNGKFEDYRKLKEYHYVRTDPVSVTGIWKLQARYPYTKDFPNPIGVVVYMSPIRDITTRNTATDNHFKQYKSMSEKLKAVNRNIVYLSRIIIDPRFHRYGLGTKLLSESLIFQTKPLIETLTPIDRYLPLFKKCGFELFLNPTPERYRLLKKTLTRCGIPEQLYNQPEVAQIRIDSLNHHKRAEINRVMRKFVSTWYHHENDRPGLEMTRFALEHIEYPNCYLLYRNPKINFPVP